METNFKCPACGKYTIGVRNIGCAPMCCPSCQLLGKVVYMLEEKKENLCNVGNGLFIKPKD
jgi:hypothetical protein